ncbi:MAG: hypothetical protein IT184_07920 [Acidobacteria bacterium]|nr:hypothetical protein [Acidobacteriota bacterium]
MDGGDAPPRRAPGDRDRTRRWIAAAVVAGLGLRLAFGLLYWVGQPLTRDEREYLSLARSLASGDGFVYDPIVRNGPVEPFGRAPGYPLFLALVGGGGAASDHVPAAVKIAQAGVGALGVLFAALVAGRLGGARAARRAAWLAAVYPPLVWISAYAFSEALFWPLALGIVLVFDRRGSTRAGGLLAGLLTGAGILVRGALVPFAALAVVWLLWRGRVAAAATFALGVALLLVPWTARNYGHHGRAVLVASEGGVTFWTGNHPLAVGDGDLAANPPLKAAQQALRARHPALTEEQMEPVYYREALAWIRQHPIDWLGLEARKVFYLIVPTGPSYTLHSTRYFVASLVSYLTVLPLAIVGFVAAGSERRRVTGLWLMALSAVAVCLVFFPQERFRVPVLDPTLIVCAACAWTARPTERRA